MLYIGKLFSIEKSLCLFMYILLFLYFFIFYDSKTYGIYLLPKSFTKEDNQEIVERIHISESCNKSINNNKIYNIEMISSGFPSCFNSKLIHNILKENNHLHELKQCSIIPKIIHQHWKNKEIPNEWLEYHKSWKEKNPDFYFLIWSEEDALEFISNYFSWFLPVYKNYKYDIERADAIRYFILYSYGGIYIDLDYECLYPLSNYIHLISKPVGFISPSDSGFSNSMMISKKGEPIWNSIIQSLINFSNTFTLTKHQHVISTTGPGFLMKVIEKSNEKNSLCALTKIMFNPCTFCDQCIKCENFPCLAIHHYAKSWNNWTSKINNLFYCQKILLISICMDIFIIIYFFTKYSLFIYFRKKIILLLSFIIMFITFSFLKFVNNK